MSLLAVEHATLATWRAEEVAVSDGWTHCASNGVSGRVNAVWPLGFTGADTDAAIRRAEAWYGARGLPCVFKITDGLCAPDDLAHRLAARGYAPGRATAIMRRTLPSNASNDAGATLSATMPEAMDEALLAAAPDPADAAERRAIALRAPQPAAFALLPGASGSDAIGMSAIAGAYAGIYLMRTRAEARRQGCARRVLGALLAWAHAHGAKAAFLQVETDNHAACALYLQEGFSTLAHYHYWKRAPETGI